MCLFSKTGGDKPTPLSGRRVKTRHYKAKKRMDLAIHPPVFLKQRNNSNAQAAPRDAALRRVGALQRPARIIKDVEQVTRLLGLLPEIYGRGLLDASGGSFAVRGSKGVYVSPLQAGPALRWQLQIDDLVLFPGPGEASMARAGRQPCRDNRSHRALLAARPDWNLSIHGHSWGLLAFALAGVDLPVVAEHYAAFKAGRAAEIHCLPSVTGGLAQLPEVVVAAMGRQFSGQPHGALLLGGNGPLVCGSTVESTLSTLELLEQLARAQQWRLVKPAPHPSAPAVPEVG